MTPDQALGLGGLLATLALVAAGFLRALRNSNVMRSDVDALQKSNVALSSELGRVQRALDEKTRASYERDERIDSLNKQLRQLENVSGEVERTNANLQGRLTEQREIYSLQFTQQSQQITDLRIAITQRDSNITNLEQAQTTKDDALARANATIIRLESELTVERVAREALDKRVKALEQQVEAMSAEREQIIKERDEARAERDKLAAELAVKEALIEDLKAQIAAALSPDVKAESSMAAMPVAGTGSQVVTDERDG